MPLAGLNESSNETSNIVWQGPYLLLMWPCNSFRARFCTLVKLLFYVDFSNTCNAISLGARLLYQRGWVPTLRTHSIHDTNIKTIYYIFLSQYINIASMREYNLLCETVTGVTHSAILIQLDIVGPLTHDRYATQQETPVSADIAN